VEVFLIKGTGTSGFSFSSPGGRQTQGRNSNLKSGTTNRGRPSALPKTIVAAIIGSAVGLFICGIGYAFLIGGSALVISVGVSLIIVSVIIGFLWGFLSALV
jgi:hypothetical protein